MPLRSTRVPAYAAAVLAFGSAAVSLYWTLGGTVLLDTVGGTFEDLARERSPASIVLGVLVVLVKVAAGLLALAFVQPWGTRVGRRLLLVSAGVGSAVLVVYGSVLVLVGGLVLAELITHPRRWTNMHCAGTCSSGTSGFSSGAWLWDSRPGGTASTTGLRRLGPYPRTSGRPLASEAEC
jgi:Protein of unknown function (DUF3995)